MSHHLQQPVVDASIQPEHLANAEAWQIIMRRYRDIVPDWKGFIQHLQQPLDICCWTNKLKIQPAALHRLLRQHHYLVQPLAWHEQAFTITRPLLDNTQEMPPIVGRSWFYLSGLLQIQEQASMLAGHLLDAQAGECVLDLCAAPGSKTAQIALQMHNQGELVANDRSYQRLRALGQIIKRLGLMNVSCTQYDGVNYPAPANYFDRVLVDAPCSCQGTTRKRWQRLPAQFESAQQSQKLAQVQRALLHKAVQLCKPGGRIIYSTCTYAPEENEAVVDWVLGQFPQALEIQNIHIPGIQHSPGLTSWLAPETQSQHSFSAELKHSMRLWPQQNNSGGFYIAMLRKRSLATAPHKTPSQGPGIDSAKSQAAVVERQPVQQPNTTIPAIFQHHVLDRFGIPPALFEQHRFYETRRGWYLLPSRKSLCKSLRHDSNGLFLMKKNTRFPKLSTTAAMLLGAHAKQNFIVLPGDQIEAYIRQQPLQIAPSALANCDSGGYVLIRYAQLNLGLGLLAWPKDGQPASLKLSSLFPQSWQGGQ